MIPMSDALNELITAYTTRRYAPQTAALYRAYRQTTHWAAMRERTLHHAEHHCQRCGQPATTHNPLDVHHRSYLHLGNEPDNDLMALCRECHGFNHGWWEYNDDGVNLTNKHGPSGRYGEATGLSKPLDVVG